MITHTLVLIPTDLERTQLCTGWSAQELGCRVELCGFGPVAAACRTMRALQEQVTYPGHRYRQVVLCGVAGSCSPHTLVGEAYWFRRVALYGVGIREGGKMFAPQALGFETELLEELPLRTPGGSYDQAKIRESLLTVCAIDDRDFAMRVDADAEDMEAYGCAAACALAGIPFMVLRGMSNKRGDRDKTHWRIGAALVAAQQMLVSYLQRFVRELGTSHED